MCMKIPPGRARGPALAAGLKNRGTPGGHMCPAMECLKPGKRAYSKQGMRILLFALLTTLLPVTAHAYVGPGAGLGAIAVTLAVVLGVVLLVVGFLWYPLKRMFRGKKAAQNTSSASSQSED